jgi:hypothetical protein
MAANGLRQKDLAQDFAQDFAGKYRFPDLARAAEAVY